jgi:Mg-chelatase subunit ChlD
MNKLKSAGILLLLLGLGLLMTSGSLEAQKVLFKSNFTDLEENWEVVDDPTADDGPGRWRAGLVELSGIKNRDYTMATALLAGDKDWKNYAVETSLTMTTAQGYLVGILCGYQDPTHFYLVGYNFYERRFELVARSPEGYELLAFFDVDLVPNATVALKLVFAGERLRLTADGREVFDLNDGRYITGGFGLGASSMAGSKVTFGPVTVRSVEPSALPPRELLDLLSFQRGAVVVSEAEKSVFKCLIDHGFRMDTKEFDSGSYMSLTLKRVGLPFEAVYAFPQGKSVEIRIIGFELAGGYFPKDVEFLVAQENQEGAFESAGTFQIKPEPESYQEFDLDGIKARFLKVRFLTADKEAYLQLNEIHVKGYREGSGPIPGPSGGDPEAGSGEVLFEDDFSSGTVDKWQIWNDPAANPKESQWQIVLSEYSNIYNYLDHPATFLMTGEQGWADYSVQARLFAVQSDGNLSGLVFGFKGTDDYYIAGYNFHNGRFELGMRTPLGFEVLAWAKMDFPRSEWMPLQVRVRGSRIQFWCDGQVIFDLDDGIPISGRAGIGTSALDSGAVNFDGFVVASSAEAGLGERGMQDILAYKRGAAVIYREIPPVGEKFVDMLDHQLLSEGKFGNTYNPDLSQDKLPQEVVFCFPQGRFVEIHRIGFRFGSQNQPREMKFWVSDQTPKTGFAPLTTITIQPGSERNQEFPVTPTRAKYLKMQISESTGSKNVEITEMFVKGHFLERADRQPGEETLGEVQLREKEPNDTPGQAQALPLSTYLGGAVAQDEVDYYRLAIKDQPGNTLTLYINNLGVLRPGYVLSSLDGTEIEPAAETALGNMLEVTYHVGPEDHLLRIYRPESFLTIVFDDSGSMGPSVDIVKKILGGYLDNLGEGLKLKLMKYEDDPTHLSDFTNDAGMLKEALEKEVRGGGGTDTFKGLIAAVDSVSLQDGNRAVLGIFDVLDCSGSKCMQYYTDLWNGILGSGISFSTIAVQKGWESETSYYNNSRQRIFKEIAYASQGEYYYSPSPEKVEESADRIFKQLTSPVAYRLKAEMSQTEQKPGSVEVRLEEGAEKKAAKNVELILDASNSMWGQIAGTAKIAIAKEVLTQIIGGLPDEMNVGLRLYGHRYGLNDSKACQDTQLVTPIGLINKAQLIGEVEAITPRGKTPLVYSVLEGIKDFKEIGSGTIVLISDGVESCDGDIEAIAPALKAAGLDLQVNIVGFDIKEVEARKQLEAIAASTGGIYLDAKDSEQLLDSLEQTLRVEFVLLDDQGRVKARGVVGGEPVQVLEGTYTLKLLLQPEPLEIRITVKPDAKATLTLKKEGEIWAIR